MAAATRMELAGNEIDETIPSTWTVLPAFSPVPPSPPTPPPPPRMPPPSSPARGGGGGGGSTLIVVLAVLAAVLVAGLAVVLALWLRSRGGRSPASPPPSASAGRPGAVRAGKNDMSTTSTSAAEGSVTQSSGNVAISVHDSAYTKTGFDSSAILDWNLDNYSDAPPLDVLNLAWGDIEIGKRLDRGNFKTVFEGKWGGNDVAIAQVPSSAISREVSTSLHHPPLI